jgi:hypothetical protein
MLSVVMLSVVKLSVVKLGAVKMSVVKLCCSAEYCYAECCYAECCCAEFDAANPDLIKLKNVFNEKCSFDRKKNSDINFLEIKIRSLAPRPLPKRLLIECHFSC